MNSAKKLLLISSLAIAINSHYFGIAGASNLEQAYNLYVSGDISASEQVYNQMLEQNQIATYEVYLSKCMAHTARSEFADSEQQYALAVTALANTPNKESILSEFDYKRSALLINHGEYSKALEVLDNYVFSSHANVRMQSDYLDALSRLGQYENLLIAAQKFWHNNYQDTPNYGVLLVADSLFKLKRYAEAEALYSLVLQRDNNHLYANLSLAYCLAKRDKQDLALEIYKKVYKLKGSSDDIILAEAEVLFSSGERQLANKIYTFIAANSQQLDKVKLSKAKALSRSGYNIAADTVLSTVSVAGQGPDYLSLKFLNKLNSELYHDAANTLNALQGSANYSSLLQRYNQARRGGMDAAFLTASNYKGNSTQTYRVEGDTYLGLNTYLTAALDTTRLSDTVHIANITTTTLGLVHRFERGKIHATVANAVSGSAHTLYSAGFSFKINDLTAIGFDFGKRYVGDSKAVLNNFIRENYYSIALAHKFNEKNSFFADYSNSSLTDINHYYGYSLSYSYYPVRDNKKTHELYTYYRRGGFSKLSPYYESPDKRIAYGLGWQARWYQTTGAYWTLRLNLELGHDNLEPTDFSPGIRVQYTHPLSKHQELSLAVEYGVRTNRLNDINYFMHGYKQFEIKYHLSW